MYNFNFWYSFCNTPKKKILKEGYLSKFFYGVNFKINISKGFLENKVETLAIYISLLCQRIWWDILERGDYSKDWSKEGLITFLR